MPRRERRNPQRRDSPAEKVEKQIRGARRERRCAYARVLDDASAGDVYGSDQVRVVLYHMQKKKPTFEKTHRVVHTSLPRPCTAATT